MSKRKNNSAVINQGYDSLRKNNDVKTNQYQDNSNHLTDTEFAKDFEECCGLEFGREFESNQINQENNRRNNINIECAREFNKNNSKQR